MKKYSCAVTGLALALVIWLCAAPAGAQGGKRTASEKSYAEARRVLDAGITALGGREAISKIEDISLKFSGINYARNQSQSPDTDYYQGRLEGEVVLDAKGNRAVVEQASALPGFKFRFRQIIKGDKGVALNLDDKTATAFTNPNALAGLWRNRFPHAMLMTALERATTLRSLGQEDFDGKRQNVIAFATADGTQWTLYFDAATNLLTKFENLDTDARAGDVTQEFIMTGYTTIGGIKIPSGRIVRRGGEVTQEVKHADVQVNAHPAESAFERPQGFDDLPANNPTPTPTVVELAKDVYLVQDAANGYNVMFVAMNDHVLVVEAPLNDGTSKRVMAKIKETVPDKPIKYVVTTHFHDDHAGGIRTYMGEGVTVVTTPGNKAYFERVAQAVRTIAPDSLTLKPRTPVIETVQNMKKVFTDGQHTVELYDIGPGPHTKEMLVVYLPKEKILFEGDMLGLPAGSTLIPAANETTRHFAERIKALGLAPEKIASVHGRTATMNDLQAAIEKSRGEKAAR
ncbi:MAG TPA: MBL fold metallo-hydrolase [Pyrinomonadaceae bacterium]|nr:MBL fold metallo-hydrolase [Pyrinomonadaceae bacterium]